MIQLDREQTATLRDWLPDRPGRLMGLHVINTGHGLCWVDRWPDPRALLINNAFDYFLAGELHVLRRVDLLHINGWVQTADESFVEILQKWLTPCTPDDRVVLELSDRREPISPSPPEHHAIRRLSSGDDVNLDKLSPAVGWIHNSWGGAAGLAASGYAFGAFVDGRLVSVACPFHIGQRYEDIGVVTEPEYRGRGLSTACAATVVDAIISRGHRPGWTASARNTASLRVAEKLRFSVTGRVTAFECTKRQDEVSLLRRGVRLVAGRSRSLSGAKHSQKST
jgi:GNAT superfamily N-acetyltransferase